MPGLHKFRTYILLIVLPGTTHVRVGFRHGEHPTQFIPGSGDCGLVTARVQTYPAQSSGVGHESTAGQRWCLVFRVPGSGCRVQGLGRREEDQRELLKLLVLPPILSVRLPKASTAFVRTKPSLSKCYHSRMTKCYHSRKTLSKCHHFCSIIHTNRHNQPHTLSTPTHTQPETVTRTGAYVLNKQAAKKEMTGKAWRPERGWCRCVTTAMCDDCLYPN